MIGMRPIVVLLEAMTFRETRHVKPVSCPALAEMLGGEQFVHYGFK